MNKLFVIVCLALSSILMCTIALGASGQIMILSLRYDNGEITFLNSTTKYGFFPDRKIPVDGYNLEILDSGKILYSFDFEAPNEMYVEGGDETGELSGGLVVLDEVEFALIVPYYSEADVIKIYSPEQKLVSSIDIKESSFNWFWLVIPLVLLLLILIVMLLRRRHS